MALTERYKSLANEIETDIYKGVFQEKLPGTLQLSAKYGVAPKTISKATALLGERGLVTARPREGTYITRMDNGRPKHMTLGLIGFPLDVEPSLQRFEMLREMALEWEYDLISLQFTHARLLEKPNLLVGMPVDGFLFDNSEITPEVILMLRQASIPFVTLNMITSVPGVCWVDFDAEDMVRKGLNYLHELGHHNIAMVGFHSRIEEYYNLLLNTYARVMSEHGEYRPEFFMMDDDLLTLQQKFSRGGMSSRDAYHQALKESARVVAERILNLSPHPTAVYVMGHEEAYDIRDELEKSGLSVPRDISIMTTCTSCPDSGDFFTRIFFDMEKRCCLGLEVLFELVDGGIDKPVQKTIPGMLLERGSTRNLYDKDIS